MLILSIAISAVYVIPFRGISQDITVSYLLEASGQIAHQVNLVFEKPLNETQLYAKNIASVYKETNRNKMLSILLDWYISKPEYMAIFINFGPYCYDDNDVLYAKDPRFVNGAFATYISRLSDDSAKIKIEPDIKDYALSEKYKIPYESQKPYISKPAYQQVSQKNDSYFYLLRISSPIIVDDISIGVVGIDFSTESIVELVSKYSVLKNPKGFCTIALGDGSIIASKDSSLQHKNILSFVPNGFEKRYLSGILKQKKGKTTLNTVFHENEKTVTGLYKFTIGNSDSSFIVMASLPEEDMYSAINASTHNAVMASLFIFIIGLLFFQILIKEIVLSPLMEQMKTIEKLSITDALTGLANRRSFEDAFDREWKVSIRNKKSIAFLMLDADKFKSYNDTYGHPQGDKLLIALSGVLKRAVHRPSDLPGRLGGEEFGVLLPNTDLHGAVHIAESIRGEVERLRIRVPETGKITTCTVSIGVAAMIPTTNDTHEIIMKIADEQLYRAKEGGRNRVYSELSKNNP
jgi:diguanylate cyclase (GGDEF)-like protein